MAQSSEIKLLKRFDQDVEITGNIVIGGNFTNNINIVKNNIGIPTTYSTMSIEATDAQLDLISSASGTWGSSINLVEGASSTANTNVWSIARQTSSVGNLLRFNFGTGNQHDNAAMMSLSTSGNLTLTGTLSASGYNKSNWDTAYGWGNHASAGYADTNDVNKVVARSLGWVPAYSTTNENAVFWNESEQAVELYSATDSSIGMSLKAVRVKFGDKVRFTTMVKGSSANTDGLYLRLYAHHGDMPDGKTHVSNNAADSSSYVQEDDSGVTNWVENGPVTTGWVTYEYTYTAPADGYVSLVVLNWGGFGLGRLYVKQPDIQFEKVNEATTANSITNGTLSSGLSVEGDLKALGQIRATGWNGSNSSSVNGHALEIGVSAPDSSEAYVLSYNRNTSSYGDMNFAAVNFNFDERGGTTTIENNEIWHAGNDGSGSGLDADTLDGYHASSFLTSLPSHSHNYIEKVFTVNSNYNFNDLYANDQLRFHSTYASNGNWTTATVTNYPSTPTISAAYAYGSTLSLRNNGQGMFQIYAPHNQNGNSDMFFRTGWNTDFKAWARMWTDRNHGSGSGLDADKLDGLQASQFLRSDAADTMSGTLTIDTGSSSDALVIKGYSPTISILDDTTSADDFYIHVNSNNFYVLTNRDANDSVGTGWEGPHPLQLEADTNISYTFGNRILTTADEGSGNGLDADTVDGLQASQFLRSDAADTFTGSYLAFPTLHLGIANNNSTNGYNTYFRGSSTHFVLGLTNGNTLYMNYGNSSGTMRTYGTMNHEGNTWMNTSRHIYSPIYYDDDNTSYYVNPASTSVLGAINMNGTLNMQNYSITNAADSSFNGDISLISGGIGSNADGASTANQVTRILVPQGGAGSWDSAQTGAIKIRLPIRANNNMWSMKVRIYDYGVERTQEYLLGNYSYSNGGYNSSVSFNGGKNATPRTVRFGNDGTYDCVWIGETNTSWSYPVVSILDFQAGFRSASVGTNVDNYDISIVTSFGTVQTSYNPDTKAGYDVYAQSSFRAPIFYDSNNTNYYVDPASTSVVNTVKFGTTGGSWGSAMVSTGSSSSWGTSALPWIGSNGGSAGSLIMLHNPHIPFRTDNNRSGASGRAGIRCAIDTSASNWWDIGLYGDAFEIYRNASGQQMFHVDNARNSYSWGSSRAPIFYDSDNTGYYVNPDSTSNFNRIDFNRYLYGNGKKIFDCYDTYLRLNQGGEWSNGIWFGNSHIKQGSDRYIAAGGNGGTTSSRVYIYGGTYTGTNVIKIDGNTGIIQTTTDSVRAPRFYDYNDTSYYVDPAGNSVMSQIHFGGYSSRAIYGASLGSGYHAVRINGNWDSFDVMGRVLDWSASNLHFGDGYNGVNHSAYYFRLGSSGNINYFHVGGDGYFEGDVIAYYSDARLKQNVKPIENALDIIKEIRGVTFEWNKLSESVWKKKEGDKDFGLIAQEVEAVFPMGVAIQAGADEAKKKGYGDPNSEHYDPLHVPVNEDEEYKTVRYDKMVSIAIQAIKEQQCVIEELKQEIQELKKLINL